MIYDALVEATLAVTPAGLPFAGSIGIDLNTDFGNGASPRKAGMPGAGHDFAIRCRVTQAFDAVAVTGAPILQAYAVLSTTGTAAAPVTSGNYVVIGASGAPTQLSGGTLLPGFVATDLALNTEFYIKCNPWTHILGRSVGPAVAGEDLRYLGIILSAVNYASGTNVFNSGLIQGNVVLASDVSQQASLGAPIHFPAGVVNK